MLKPFTDTKVAVDTSTKIPARTGNQKGYITPEDLAAIVAPLVPPGEPGPSMVSLTMAEYDALEPKDPAIYYDIIDAPWEP